MKERNDLIMELPGFVPESLCNFMIDNFEKEENKLPGQMMYGGERIIDKTLKDSDEWIINNENATPLWKDVDTILCKYIERAAEVYIKYLSEEYPGPMRNEQKLRTFEALLTSIERNGVYDNGFTIQRQKRGVKYGWHFDSMQDSILFGILYLNTFNEDEGGCTEFITGRKVRPEAGKIMLSPAHWSYAHCGNEVKKEYKYTIPFMVFHAKRPTTQPPPG